MDSLPFEIIIIVGAFFSGMAAGYLIGKNESNDDGDCIE